MRRILHLLVCVFATEPATVKIDLRGSEGVKTEEVSSQRLDVIG